MKEVRMQSMPSFVGKVTTTVEFHSLQTVFCIQTDVLVDVPSVGEVVVDLVFGGMWFVVVRADSLGMEIRPENGAQLARWGHDKCYDMMTSVMT